MADAGVYNDAGSTLASNADGVYQWNDQSGNGNHAIQTTSANRPQYLTGVLNGLPTIRFNGATPNWLTLISPILEGVNSTVFCVAKYSADPTVFNELNYILGLPSAVGGSYTMHMAGDFGSGTLLRKLHGPLEASTGTVAINTYYQFNLKRQDTNPRPWVWRINGAFDSSGTSGAFGTASGAQVIGKQNTTNNNSPLYGDICELIVYHRQLTDSEIATVEYYLNDKWFGLSFSPSPSPSHSVSPSSSASPS